MAAGSVMAASATEYVRTLFSTDSNATIPERLGSIADGLETLARDPLSGVGLGRYGTEGGYMAAHSTVVQAAAEMGVLGLAALLLLSGALVLHAVRVVRAEGWLGLRPAAAVAVADTVHAALAAPANSGLYVSYVSIWGLTCALLIGLCPVRR